MPRLLPEDRASALLPAARGVFSLAIVTVVTALTYVRLYFGVDLTDESFYTAVPYRFVLGARPLIDETNVAQLTPGLLLFPFVKAYDAVAGLDGLMLYMRHLHLLFCIAVSLALFFSLRRCLRDAALSALLAAIAVAFVPFGIHGLSYNTFGSGFFAAGCFLGLAPLAQSRPHQRAFAGAAQGLAIFTYPPFALPVACFFAALYVYDKPRSLRALVPGLIPAVVGCIAVSVFFLEDGLNTARELFARASTYSGQGGGLGKALDILNSVLSTFPHKYLAVGLVVVALALHHWRGWPAIVPLLALPLIVLPPDLATSASSNEYITSFGLLAPGVFALEPRDAVARRLLILVWIPSVVAGEVTALSSSNGSINFAIGFFPAAIVTATLIAMFIRRLMPGNWTTPARTVGEFASAITVLAVGVGLQYAFVYRDAGLTHLNARVATGAYAGIYTTSARRGFLHQLDQDLRGTSGPSCRIVFYDSFPAGYLLGHGDADTNTALLLDVTGDQEAAYERLLLSYYASHGGPPDIAVRIDRIPLGGTTVTVQTYRASDPLQRLFRGTHYRTVRVRPDYRISRSVTTDCR